MGKKNSPYFPFHNVGRSALLTKCRPTGSLQFSVNNYLALPKNTRSSLEANTVNMLLCLHSLLVIRQHLSEKTLVLFTVINGILGKISHFGQTCIKEHKTFLIEINE